MIKTFLIDDGLLKKGLMSNELYAHQLVTLLKDIHSKRGFLSVISKDYNFINEITQIAREDNDDINKDYENELKSLFAELLKDYHYGGNGSSKKFIKINENVSESLKINNASLIDSLEYIDCLITNDEKKLKEIKKSLSLQKYNITLNGPYDQLNKYLNQGTTLVDELDIKPLNYFFGKIILNSSYIHFTFYKFLAGFFDKMGNLLDINETSKIQKRTNDFKKFLQILINYKMNEKNHIFENQEEKINKKININIYDVPPTNDWDPNIRPNEEKIKFMFKKLILDDDKIMKFHQKEGINLNFYILYHSDEEEINKIKIQTHERKFITEYERILLNFNLDILADARYLNENSKVGEGEKFSYAPFDGDQLEDLLDRKDDPNTLQILNILGEG